MQYRFVLILMYSCHVGKTDPWASMHGSAAFPTKMLVDMPIVASGPIHVTVDASSSKSTKLYNLD